MKFAHIACAFGRHKLDPNAVRRVHGGQVSRCRHCSTPLEEVMPFEWAAMNVRDAGLSERRL
jgi:hypothetical protein